jgi:hypothetical protein
MPTSLFVDGLFTAVKAGFVPASGGAADEFLCADGTWKAGGTGPAGADGADGADGATGPAGPAPAGTGFVKVTGGVLDVPAATISTAEIADNAVTVAKMGDAAALTALVRAVNSSGDRSDLAFAADGDVIRRVGNALVSSDAITVLEAGGYGILGSGADGALNFDGVNPVAGATLFAANLYALTRDIYPTSCVVASGVTVFMDAWRCIGNGACTGSGTFDFSGTAGGNGIASSAGLGATSVAANTVGGRLGGALGGVPRGFTAGTVAGGTGNGGNGAAGQGAPGGGNGAAVGGNGGTVTLLADNLGSGLEYLPDAFAGRAINRSSIVTGGSAGGGGRGAVGANPPGGGGGGGGGGGVLVIAFRTIESTITLRAKGGAGGNAYRGAGSTNPGGGGGGGGGIIICGIAAGTGPAVMDVTGGAGGLSGLTGGGAGGNGGAGLARLYRMSV